MKWRYLKCLIHKQVSLNTEGRSLKNISKLLKNDTTAAFYSTSKCIVNCTIGLKESHISDDRSTLSFQNSTAVKTICVFVHTCRKTLSSSLVCFFFFFYYCLFYLSFKFSLSGFENVFLIKKKKKNLWKCFYLWKKIKINVCTVEFHCLTLRYI